MTRPSQWDYTYQNPLAGLLALIFCRMIVRDGQKSHVCIPADVRIIHEFFHGLKRNFGDCFAPLKNLHFTAMEFHYSHDLQDALNEVLWGVRFPVLQGKAVLGYWPDLEEWTETEILQRFPDNQSRENFETLVTEFIGFQVESPVLHKYASAFD